MCSLSGMVYIGLGNLRENLQISQIAELILQNKSCPSPEM